MIEEEAWPSAQAFTSWAKSVTISPSILRSMVTVEPQSLEWAVAVASGWSSRPEPGNIPGQFQNSAVVDVVQHELRQRRTGGSLIAPRLQALYRDVPLARARRHAAGWSGFRQTCFLRKPCKMGMRRPIAAHGSNSHSADDDAAAPVTPPAVERRSNGETVDGRYRQALAQSPLESRPVGSCARGPRAGLPSPRAKRPKRRCAR